MSQRKYTENKDDMNIIKVHRTVQFRSPWPVFHTGLTRDVGNNQNNFPFQQFCGFEATQHKIKTVNNH